MSSLSPLPDDQDQEHAVLPRLPSRRQSGTIQGHQALVELVFSPQGQDVAFLHVLGRVAHHGEPRLAFEVPEEGFDKSQNSAPVIGYQFECYLTQKFWCKIYL